VIDAFRLLAAARAQPPRSPASTHASGKWRSTLTQASTVRGRSWSRPSRCFRKG